MSTTMNAYKVKQQKKRQVHSIKIQINDWYSGQFYNDSADHFFIIQKKAMNK